MKKFLLMLPLLGVLTACCCNNKCAPIAEEPIATNYEEIYAGTFPAADCSGIYYMLRLYTPEVGADTLFTLETTYLDAEGDGLHKLFVTNGKHMALDTIGGFRLHPDNGDPVMNFIVVDATTLRMVNDSLQEIGIHYDLIKVEGCAGDDCSGECSTCENGCQK